MPLRRKVWSKDRNQCQGCIKLPYETIQYSHPTKFQLPPKYIHLTASTRIRSTKSISPKNTLEREPSHRNLPAAIFSRHRDQFPKIMIYLETVSRPAYVRRNQFSPKNTVGIPSKKNLLAEIFHRKFQRQHFSFDSSRLPVPIRVSTFKVHCYAGPGVIRLSRAQYAPRSEVG